ncbi:MAG: 1,4-dihydroxy-2-naphthoate polyprenyltransferase [Deltaproteobacteria bacterium]|nr:1,4-dihydroxy-2-naphthoate polyprenyltransferase [Deltaproteobacteria bacterium]MBW2361569.1 1,4-dihydroxy-2-naphthoate polyprenyltransferase [Deltaproteobacteria bacterium]
MSAPSPAPPGAVAVWLSAARLRTLPIALAPVVVGTALAWTDDAHAWLAALAAALGALLLQIGANFANDVFDFEKGADTAARTGPPRATQLGWVTPAAMRRATFLIFGAAFLPGLYLVWVGGWPIVAIGLLSVATGLAYTGGPFPLGYHGLGDLAVFVFFGLVAVCGTYWVQALTLPPHVLAVSTLIGALASVPLAVNNLRDAATDALAGKRTLAVRLGESAVRTEIAALIAIAYAGCVLLWWSGLGPLGALLPLITSPLALRFLHRMRTSEGAALNPLLAESARLELVFALSLALGWAA